MWFYEVDGIKYGPVDADAIEQLLRDNVIDDVTLVRREGEDAWRHLDETDLIWVVQGIQADAEETTVSTLGQPPLPQNIEMIANGGKVWYYKSDDVVFGPLSSTEMQDMSDQKVINSDTAVSEDGASTWKPFGKTELIFGPGTVPPILPIKIKPDVDLPRLKRLFNWWALSNLLEFLIIVGEFWLYPKDFVFKTVVFAISIPFGFIFYASIILEYILFYRLWQVVQDGYAKISPGFAIGFLFIPVFNFYWMFRVYIGLANELNSYIDRHFEEAAEVREAHPYIPTLYLISSIIFGIAVMVYFFTSFLSDIRTSIGHNFNPFNYFQQFLIPIIVVNVLDLALKMFTFLDYYFTSVSILEAQGENEE